MRSASGDRASYTYALGHFRRLLVQRGGVPAEYVQMYTLHSLKVTPLSWALQLNIDKESRRLWGHHRCRESGAAMASKYSRDDVLPALRARVASYTQWLGSIDTASAGWAEATGGKGS